MDKPNPFNFPSSWIEDDRKYCVKMAHMLAGIILSGGRYLSHNSFETIGQALSKFLQEPTCPDARGLIKKYYQKEWNDRSWQWDHDPDLVPNKITDDDIDAICRREYGYHGY